MPMRQSPGRVSASFSSAPMFSSAISRDQPLRLAPPW
ncbi:hypothetical protein QE373_000919 [Stenotrophomonas sp. SORGH_AS321]|nr:hypothetical protein [Stenotrophomonas sp. SORGH_AS_0321]